MGQTTEVPSLHLPTAPGEEIKTTFAMHTAAPSFRLGEVETTLVSLPQWQGSHQVPSLKAEACLY